MRVRRDVRVLAIIDTVQISGPGRQLVASALLLRSLGVRMHILMFQRRGRPTSPYEGFLAESGVDFTVVEESGKLDRLALARLANVVRSFDPDIIQSHGYKPGAFVWALKAYRTRAKWIAFYHGATAENMKVRLYHWVDQRIMRRADAIVVMSNAHLRGFGDGSVHVRLVHNAVLKPAQERAKPHSASVDPQKAHRIAVVGRLSHEKGVDVLLQACARLSAKGMRFHLNVVGDGPDKQALMDQCRDLGLGARTSFMGHVADTDAIYSTSDLLVIPSRSEGLPNVLLEAMRFGLPSAATSVGAVPEVLSDPLAGVLCSPNDIDGLATAITTALAPGYFERGLHARTEVLHRFSLSARCLTLRNIYDELLSNEFIEGCEDDVMPASSTESDK